MKSILKLAVVMEMSSILEERASVDSTAFAAFAGVSFFFPGVADFFMISGSSSSSSETSSSSLNLSSTSDRSTPASAAFALVLPGKKRLEKMRRGPVKDTKHYAGTYSSGGRQVFWQRWKLSPCFDTKEQNCCTSCPKSALHARLSRKQCPTLSNLHRYEE